MRWCLSAESHPTESPGKLVTWSYGSNDPTSWYDNPCEYHDISSFFYFFFTFGQSNLSCNHETVLNVMHRSNLRCGFYAPVIVLMYCTFRYLLIKRYGFWDCEVFS